MESECSRAQALQQSSHRSEKPARCNKAPLSQLEKAHAQQQRPGAAKKLIN